MTTYTPNTPISTQEAARETDYSLAFSTMMTAWRAYIEAERDLEDINWSGDPAFGFWERDRASSEACLRSVLRKLHHMPVRLPEDRPLQRVVALVTRMLDEDEALYPRQLHREMTTAFFRLYQVRGIGPVARHRNGLLIQARHLADAMIVLPFFSYVPEDGLTPPDPTSDVRDTDALTCAA